MKNSPAMDFGHKTTGFCTLYIDKTPTQVTANPYTTATLNSQVFVSIFATRMVLSARELFAIEKMATVMGNKKIATTLGLPLSTTKRRATTWPGGWFCVLCDLCVCSVGPMIESGARSCQDANCGHHCTHHAVQSPVFANVCRPKRT